MIVGPYRITEYEYTATAVATHTAPVLAYRAWPQPVCFMAIEGHHGPDCPPARARPAEVRLRNMVPTAELPWTNIVGVRYDTGSFVESLEMAMEMASYDEFRAGQAQGRLVDGKYRGIGICSFTEVSGTGAPGWRARGLTRLPGFDSGDSEGGAHRQSDSLREPRPLRARPTSRPSLRLSPDALGARLEDVTVVEGDTAAGPYGTNTFASRSAVTGRRSTDTSVGEGQAEAGADRRIHARVHARRHRGLRRPDARRRRAERALSFQEVAETAYAMNTSDLPEGESFGIEETDFYDPPLVTMANATHIAQVAVDAADGTVDIEGYVVVHDCGRVINPMIVDGQVMGGVAQGIGEALMEGVRLRPRRRGPHSDVDGLSPAELGGTCPTTRSLTSSRRRSTPSAGSRAWAKVD